MIDKKTIETLASTAMLDLTDDEKDCLAREIGNIIECFKVMNNIDLMDTLHPDMLCSDILNKNTNVCIPENLREDDAAKFEGSNGILNNAPRIEGFGFLVPKILDSKHGTPDTREVPDTPEVPDTRDTHATLGSMPDTKET